MARLRLQARPAWNLLLALIAFAALDTIVFKSGLYAWVASPASTAGRLLFQTRMERRRRPAPGVDEALILGDSKLAEGFSPRVADAVEPQSRLRLISAAVPGISLRGMYYLMRAVDPTRSRYREIVVPLYFYRAHPVVEDMRDRMLDVDMLAPISNLGDYVELARDFATPALQAKVLVDGLVGSIYFGPDVRDFLGNPWQRARDVGWYTIVGDRLAYQYDGHPESMAGLAYDPATHVVTYPPRLNPTERALVDSYFREPEPAERAGAAAYADYTRQWLGRIVADYRGTRTRIVVICMPQGPLPLPRLQPQPDAPSLVAPLAGEPGVTVLDEQTFANLARPELYFDMLHLNAAGRIAFSQQLVAALRADSSRQP